MAKRRRGQNNNQNQRQGQGKGQGQQKQQSRRPGESAAQRFWGDPAAKRAEPTPIRPTPDPGALVRSLGNPPLSPAAAHQLAVVYEEAVRAATALAAANGLLDASELE
ncbi:MAG TPA: hypothetical protein VK611_15310 [Acidimicrobiales bacterium]|nr:hypothetical protein [Acidimicrobiales bacterium]